MLRLVVTRARHLSVSNTAFRPVLREQSSHSQDTRFHFAALHLKPRHGRTGRPWSDVPNAGNSRSLSSTSPASNGGILGWYLRMLDQYPLVTKSLTAAHFFAISDITAQGLAAWMAKQGEPKEDWDRARTLRMLAIGMFLSAPALHMWFNLLSWAIPKTDVISVMKKVFLGQAVFSPIFNCGFFSVNSLAQGENWQQAVERIKRDLIPTWQSGIIYWPILDFITFRYLPVRLQVLFNNCCSFVWTIYLTSMAGKKAVASADQQKLA